MLDHPKLRRERNWLMCFGIFLSQLARVCPSHAATRRRPSDNTTSDATSVETPITEHGTVIPKRVAEIAAGSGRKSLPEVAETTSDVDSLRVTTMASKAAIDTHQCYTNKTNSLS